MTPFAATVVNGDVGHTEESDMRNPEKSSSDVRALITATIYLAASLVQFLSRHWPFS